MAGAPSAAEWQKRNRSSAAELVYRDENVIAAKLMLNAGRANELITTYDGPTGLLGLRRGQVVGTCFLQSAAIVAVALRAVLPLHAIRARLTVGAILTILALSVVALGTILALRAILALALLAVVAAIAVVAAVTIAVAIIVARAIVVLLVVAIALVIAALVALIRDALALAFDARDGLAIVVIILLVLVERLAVLAARLFEARARLGEHAEIMVRELQIIFGVDAVALHLRVAGERLVFLEQLGGITARTIVDAVAIVLAARITLRALLLPATAATAAGLTIIDQVLLSCPSKPTRSCSRNVDACPLARPRRPSAKRACHGRRTTATS